MPYDVRMKTTIGSPNQYQDLQYSWYIPTDQALSMGAKILRTQAIETMKGIVTLIKDITVSASRRIASADLCNSFLAIANATWCSDL
jgi:hypothetical protein